MDAEKLEIRDWARGKGNGHFRRTCPFCSPHRRNKRSECLSVDITPEKAVWLCHHCEERGAVRLEDAPQRAPVARREVIEKPKEQSEAITEDVIAYMKKRGIGEDTVKLFDLRRGVAYFRELRRETYAVMFPYYRKNKVYGHKIRSMEDKQHVCDKPLSTAFGVQNVDLDEEKQIVFCEGELDSLSMYEAGVLNAVSVPNGAQSLGSENKGFLWEMKDLVERAEKIVIAVDNDEPGEKLAEELARRIGRHKCWRVIWPEGCKDANDVLMRHGGDVLSACVSSAEPWPISGLYEATRYYEEIDDLFLNGHGELVKTGFTSLDSIYSVAPGALTVVTGIPNHGKTTFVNQMMVNLARMYGHVSLICSFETPPTVHIPVLAEMLLQKPFFKENNYGVKMSFEELRSTYGFINTHFKFMQQEDGAKATMESVLERIKTAVFRWGVRNVVIDPFNYVERPKNSESETGWIDDILTRIRLLAQAYGLHIWFIAHTTKMQQNMDGSYRKPGGYDISGSGAWFAKPDHGLTVYQDHEQPSAVTIVCWKVRFNWLGQKGEADLAWDDENKRYMCDMDDLPPWSKYDDFKEEA